MTGDCAGRSCSNSGDSVGATRRAAGLRLHVGRYEVAEVASVTGVPLVFHGALLFRRVDLLKVSNTRLLAARFAGLDEVRHGDGEKNTDD